MSAMKVAETQAIPRSDSVGTGPEVVSFDFEEHPVSKAPGLYGL